MEGVVYKTLGKQTIRYMNFKLKILDKYIIKKFIGTYFFILLISIGVIIIFDISEKLGHFVDNNAPLAEIVFSYYGNFVPYFMNMLSPLFVFITVIFFTTKLASHSEVIAILAGGISFKKLLYPYFLSAAIIALMSLLLGLYVIPPANKTRLMFSETYIKKKYENRDRHIHFQLSPGNYVYMESFNSWNNVAYNFTLETVEEHKLVSRLYARNATWKESINGWDLRDYTLRTRVGNEEEFTRGRSKDTIINLTIEDLNRRDNSVEAYDSQRLNELIDTQKMRGDRMVIYSQIEKQTRLALPFSAFILTLIGVSVSSQKRRGGGMGFNIAIGLILSFTYILFLRFSQMFVHAGVLDPWIALWMPNVLYSIIAITLYRLAPK